VRGRLRRLRRRHRLAGEDGLVAFELVGLDDPQIGGHDVADLQGHDVTGDEDAHVHLASRAVPPGQGAVVDVAKEGCDRPRGAVLVDEAQSDAQDQDQGDDRR
jgi:hypothetical protein